jgi:hypothetical protein
MLVIRDMEGMAGEDESAQAGRAKVTNSGDGRGPSTAPERRWQAPRWAHGTLTPTPKATDEEPADQDDDSQDDQELNGEADAGCVDVHQRCH